LKVHFSRIRRSKVFLQFFYSYMILVAIITIISAVIFSRILVYYKNEIINTNQSTLNQLQISIDNYFTDMNKLLNQLVLNPILCTVVNTPKDHQNSDFYFNVYNLNKNLRAYLIANHFFSDLYIYIKETNMILSSTCYIDSELAFNFENKFSGFSYNEWIDILKEPQTVSYLKITQTNTLNESKNKTAFLYPMFFAGESRSPATLIILVDEEQLKASVGRIMQMNNNMVAIFGENNKLISSSLDVNDILPLDDDLFKDNCGYVDFSLKKKHFIMTYSVSSISGWKYIALSPYNVFYDKIRLPYILVVTGILFSFFVGSVFSAIFLKKNYNPISNLIKLIAKKTGIDSAQSNNEFVYLQETISNVFDANLNLQKLVHTQSNELRFHFARKLLNGQIENFSSIESMLPQMNINFTADYFFVMLFSIENYDALFAGSQKFSNYKKIKTVHFVFTNIVEELVSKNSYGVVVEMGPHLLACIVNLKSEDISSQDGYLVKLGESIYNIITENFFIDFAISVSNIHKTLVSISDAYEEALEAMAYKATSASPNEKIIFYKNIAQDIKASDSYGYPIESEYKIINLVKVGDFDKAADLIKEIFNHNFVENRPAPQVAKLLMSDISSTVIKIVDAVSNRIDCHSVAVVTERLTACETALDLQNQIVEIFRGICDNVLKSKLNSEKTLSEKIIDILGENYHDVNLSISMIAEILNLSPSYIGKTFKEQTGQVLVEYINQFRIDKSKDLLANSPYNVNKIAKIVGYTNANVFIRSFKRLLGVTPGAYRNIISPNK